jgi:hypothetical protein
MMPEVLYGVIGLQRICSGLTLAFHDKNVLVLAERRETVVQIHSVVMIALLAICRKVIEW